MDSGEKYTVLENMIYAFAARQFDLNEVSDDVAVLIMKGVLNRLYERQINHVLMNRVQFTSDEAEKIEKVAEALNKFYSQEDTKNGNSDETGSIR